PALPLPTTSSEDFMTPDTSPTDSEQPRRRRLVAAARCRLVYFGQNQMLVPDAAGTAHRWGVSQRECRAGSARRRETHRARTGRSRLWMPQAGRPASAEPGALHQHVSQPQGMRVREACHV
ncbi:hypothetical protein, partial [Streptomyces lavenduligriseus]